ncbi:hypothetical protein FPV67DRAFT_269931 [Lyophyllum atratum]|nr:hypothetical protein FPV67DRAFT_269931 [Lyophyllum atratum]
MVAQILSYPAFSILLSYKLTARVFGELARLSLGYHTVPELPVTIPNPIISTPTSPLNLSPTPTSLAQPSASISDYVGPLAWPVAILILALGAFLSSKALAWMWRSALVSDFKLRVRHGFALALGTLSSIRTWAALSGSSLLSDVKLGLRRAQSFVNHMNDLYWDEDCDIPVGIPVLVVVSGLLLDDVVGYWFQLRIGAALKMYPFLWYPLIIKSLFGCLLLTMITFIIIPALAIFEVILPRSKHKFFSWPRWSHILGLDIVYRWEEVAQLQGQLDEAQLDLAGTNRMLSTLQDIMDDLIDAHDILRTQLLPPSYDQVPVLQVVTPRYGVPGFTDGSIRVVALDVPPAPIYGVSGFTDGSIRAVALDVRPVPSYGVPGFTDGSIRVVALDVPPAPSYEVPGFTDGSIRVVALDDPPAAI